MPYINNAPNIGVNVRIDKFRYAKGAIVNPAQTNCSLCTCAAVITHATGQLVTSGDVAASVQLTVTLHSEVVADPSSFLQHSQTFSGKGWQGADRGTLASVSGIENLNSSQRKGIARVVKARLGLCEILKMGDESDQKRTLNECVAYMRALAERGFIFAVLSAGSGHWNFAHKKGADIQFIDYQTNHHEIGDGSPATGTQFQEAMLGGDADGNKLGSVLSFQCQDHFPDGPAT